MKRNIVPITWLGTFILSLTCVNFSAALAYAQPEARSDKGITYLSGGIGLDERDALRATARDYNLMLSFAEKAGNYVSGVEVVIKDSKGSTILETVSQGPWFFMKLLAGRYTMMATTMGKTNQQVAKVPAKGQTQLYFYW
ncbi:MAG: carboxypeptidase regulatory-like domain-containing protein [Deltaproteobacteria bacterium]|nr:carboxypeptidase regulatory-like domain-containing protein [Deltaproteobacteria bacterium]